MQETIRGNKDGIIEFLRRDGDLEKGKLSKLEALSRCQDVPLSYAQESLWIVDKVDPDSSAYNIPVIYKIRERLDTECLKKSIAEIIKRHEALLHHICNI